MKKGTIPLLMILVIVVILYFGWPGIRKWWKEDRLKSNTSQSTLKPELPQTQPVEADLPLNSKAAAVACGKTLKLEGPAFMKLDIMRRLLELVRENGFTEEELKELGPEMDLQDKAFGAYSLGYLTWDKPATPARAELDKNLTKGFSSLDMSKLSSPERAHVATVMMKLKGMLLKAFDLGRHDAKISPCPY